MNKTNPIPGNISAYHPPHPVDVARLFAFMLLVCISLVGCTPNKATIETIKVTIAVDGKQVPLQVPAGTSVQVAIQQAGIALGNLDRVEPASYTILSGGDSVKVTRVREAFNIKENIIPFDHQTVHNESLTEGKTLLVQQGVNGVEQVTYRQVFEDDKEVSSVIFKTERLVEPLPEIMMVGVQKPFTPVPIPGKLAYLAGGNAWVMETSTGSRRPVVTTGDLDGRVFSLSPKSDWLLFTRVEKTAGTQASAESTPGASGATGAATTDSTVAKINSLWAIDLTEENSKPVNLKVDNVIHFAAWVPGRGLTISYSTVEPRDTSPGWQANNDLQMLTFGETGAVVKQETILETNMGGIYGWWGTTFAWSSDGAMLAYARPDEVGLIDLEAKTQVPLASILPFQTGSTWAWVPDLGWSADNKVLYLVTHASKAGLESEQASPLFDVAGLPLGSKPFANSGPLISIVPQAGMFAYPVPAPALENQANQVAYLQAIFPEQSQNKRYRLAIMDRDGSNSKVIFPSEDRQGLEAQRVVWSPEPFTSGDMWLAVVDQGNLWLVNASSGESQPITGDGLISRVDWR